MTMTLARVFFYIATLATSGCASIAPQQPLIAPSVDYHQHLISPQFSEIVKLPVFDGAALVKKLDEAGVKRAVVLSTGYSMADERKGLSDPDARTSRENDWTSAEIASTNGRLIAFCGVNPLRDAALAEIQRCLALPGMHGVKLHFGNSGVSLRNPAHLSRMGALVSLVGRNRMPVLIHMRARGGENFGAQDAKLLIAKLLPLVPNSDVIVAHFGGAGPGYPAQADEVMAEFAAAVARNDPRLHRTFFDMATILTGGSTAADAALITLRIRQLGPARILYGSDLLTPTAPTIRENWGFITNKLGLTTRELRIIADNRLSFVRQKQ